MSEFWSALIMIAVTLPSSNSVRCYMCMPKRSDHVNEYENTKLCSVFDASEKFTIDCPHSTMCVQSEITLDMENGFTTQVSHRYCAHQTEKDNQVYDPGVGWVIIKPVHEIYDVGCTLDENNGEKLTRNKICYCRGDLCNGGSFGPVNIRARKLTSDEYIVIDREGHRLTTVQGAISGHTDSNRPDSGQAWSGSNCEVASVYVIVLCFLLLCNR